MLALVLQIKLDFPLYSFLITVAFTRKTIEFLWKVDKAVVTGSSVELPQFTLVDTVTKGTCNENIGRSTSQKVSDRSFGNIFIWFFFHEYTSCLNDA